MEVVRSGCRQKFSNRQRLEMLGEKMGGPLVPSLDLPMDDQKGFRGDDEAITLEDIGINDGIGETGLVLERDEDDPLGGPGALAADHRAGSDHVCLVGCPGQTGGGQKGGRKA